LILGRFRQPLRRAGGFVVPGERAGARRILFLFLDTDGGAARLYSIRADGLGRRKLPRARADATLSPDGTRLAFVGGDSPREELPLRVGNSDGANARMLTPPWLY